MPKGEVTMLELERDEVRFSNPPEAEGEPKRVQPSRAKKES